MMKVRNWVWWRLRAVRPWMRRPLVWWRHRDVRKSDYVLGHYPKSGSTWLGFMLGEILIQQTIDFDNEHRLMPPVERAASAPVLPASGGRVLRTHESYRRTFQRGIYLVRHVNDVAVSYYNWLQWWNPIDVDFSTFLRMFLEGRVASQGPWQAHVASWLTAAQTHDILVVKYEELRKDPEQTLIRILRHMDAAWSKDAVKEAVLNNSLEGMREKEKRAQGTRFYGRDTSRQFVRKGGVEDWRNWMSGRDLNIVATYAGPVLERLSYSLDSGETGKGEYPHESSAG